MPPGGRVPPAAISATKTVSLIRSTPILSRLQSTRRFQ
nr:MAG TPA: hypothetical protein [Caudoviricetes sp.]